MGANTGLTNLRVRALLINPDNPDVIYAGTSGGGVFSSLNGGQSWVEMNLGWVNSNVSSLYFDTNSRTLYAGTFNSSIWRYVVESVSVTDYEVMPFTILLHQNYPNPFNPVTTIRYELPQRSDVQITIYDLMRREVITLLSETQDAGYKSVQWDATNSNGQQVSTGVYLYRIKADGFVETRKMVLLR